MTDAGARRDCSGQTVAYDAAGNPDPSGVYRASGAAMSLAEINRRSQRRPLAETTAVPDIPAERYDVCSCGHPRFMHPRSRPITRPGVPASEFGSECWLTYGDVART